MVQCLRQIQKCQLNAAAPGRFSLQNRDLDLSTPPSRGYVITGDPTKAKRRRNQSNSFPNTFSKADQPTRYKNQLDRNDFKENVLEFSRHFDADQWWDFINRPATRNGSIIPDKHWGFDRHRSLQRNPGCTVHHSISTSTYPMAKPNLSKSKRPLNSEHTTFSYCANQHTKIPHLPLSVAIQPTHEPNARRSEVPIYKDGTKP